MQENSINTEIAKEVLKEQRRGRRWGIFFKLLFFAYLTAILFFYGYENIDSGQFSDHKHTALIEINGVISADADANADIIISSLEKAYSNKNTAGIILRINSPGGSPVQAGYINDEINRLKGTYPDVPLYAVITDMCASGGYYIAVAADKIFADKASIIGSIGVIISGFGFVDAIDKLGIERRLLHSGEHKALMDPFTPLDYSEQSHMQGLVDEIHQQFISIVKEGRGDFLADDEEIFSGLVWSGKRSLELGLVDDLASTNQVARDFIGTEFIVNFTKRENYFDRFAKQVGASLFYNFNRLNTN